MASDLQDKIAMPMVSAALPFVLQVTHHMGDIQSREKDTQTVLAGVIESNICQELFSKRIVVRID